VKTRSFVSGTGKKPFRQKGTGGARQGSKRGPHMPGGAVVHGPQPRDYTQKVNPKTKLLALKVALSDRARNNAITVLDDFSLSGYSTKNIVSMLKALKLDNGALLADERKDDLLYKSARNIYKVNSVSTMELNAEQVISHQALVICEKALSALQQRFAAGE
jgi:large subunit ribosomal protein L4